jgi:hypothetical protein
VPDNFRPSVWPLPELNQGFTHKASEACFVGDLAYWDSGASAPRSANNLADLGTAALMQASFAKTFLGVFNSKQQASDATGRPARIRVGGETTFGCVSATYNFGDYVAPNYANNALDPQTLVKVNYPFLAIGRVLQTYTSAVTEARVLFRSRYLASMFDWYTSIGQGQGQSVNTLADQNNTLTVDSAPIQLQTPGANPRKLIMPAESASAGLRFFVVNQAGATNAIQVRNSGDAATIVSIPATKTGILWCDGTSWYGLVSA